MKYNLSSVTSYARTKRFITSEYPDSVKEAILFVSIFNTGVESKSRFPVNIIIHSFQNIITLC